MPEEIGGFPDVTLSEGRRNQLLLGGRLLPGCTVYHRASGAATVVDYQGFLDKKTAPAFHEFLAALLEDGSKLIVVNFAKLEYVSSAGIHLLIGAVRKFRKAEGDFRICCAPDKVRQVIELVGVDTMVKMYEDEEKAVAAVRGH